MNTRSRMSWGLSLFLALLLFRMDSAKASGRRDRCRITQQQRIARVGAVVDFTSRVGKEQKIAMDIAIKDLLPSTCHTIKLLLNDSQGSSAKATAAAINLLNGKQVEAVIGSLTMQEAAILSEIENPTTKNFTILSLTSTATNLSSASLQHLNFVQVSNDIVLHMKCIAALVDHFNWRKVTAISGDFSSNFGSITLLSDSLKLVNSEIERHQAFPILSSPSDREILFEEELKKLRSKSNRVFIVMQFSLTSAALLFEKAKQMGMMGTGYVWIVTDDIASLLDSVDSSIMYNMQGVIGIKTNLMENTKNLRQFKTRFRRFYGLQYPDEENSSPSIFALRAYDSIQAIALAMKNATTKELYPVLVSTKFQGLSGMMEFKNGMLSQQPTFQIINVIGKSYREIAFWSPRSGFSEDLIRHADMKKKTGDGSIEALGSIYWPGGLQEAPKGWTPVDGDRRLRIGVPDRAAFNQFVKVMHHQEKNEIEVSGFSIKVFEKVIHYLPYDLPHDFVPFNRSYDELMEQVYNKSLDVAVGDIEVIADRYRYVEFSQPYISSGLQMVVTVKPDKLKERWMFRNAFTKSMWLQMIITHLVVCFVVWFIESEDGHNLELKGIGAVMWFSVTIVFFTQRERVQSNWARLALAPWLLVILVVTTTFTASLTAMMTTSGIVPSVPDLETIRSTNGKVGCDGNSFIKKYLTDVLKLDPGNIIGIANISDYPPAFKNGTIQAAFFVCPHANVFLASYCKGFMKVGPIHKPSGFAFAFPKGSPLIIDMSEAILKANQMGQVKILENEMLSSYNCSSSSNSHDGPIGTEPFSGLFFISGLLGAFALLVTIVRKAYRQLQKSNWIRAMLIKTRILRWALRFLIQSQRKSRKHCPILQTRNRGKEVDT